MWNVNEFMATSDAILCLDIYFGKVLLDTFKISLDTWYLSLTL